MSTIPELSDSEREQLLGEFNKLRGRERKRQRQAVFAVFLSVLVTVAVGAIVLLPACYVFDVDDDFVVVLTGIPLFIGGAIYRKLYPRDFWGRQ